MRRQGMRRHDNVFVVDRSHSMHLALTDRMPHSYYYVGASLTR